MPELPQLGRMVDIPVYLVHNSDDPEDYFFIFDFELFVEQSRQGLFVRPKLQVWAGRDDFNRPRFAGQFRESFTHEFDLARAALENSNESSGWFSWGGLKEIVTTNGASFVANVVLLVSLSAGKMVWNALSLPRIFEGRSKESQLEEAIKSTQGKVDKALEAMDIKLHKQLWEHAWNRGSTASPSGLDFDAWPLPKNVAEHLDDGNNSSWW